jgi:hypothetical protein
MSTCSVSCMCHYFMSPLFCVLKVLAVSDIVIYRTRSERLHGDLFTFLGSASRAYTHHFQGALQAVGQRSDLGGPLSALGPAVIIFHETRHTHTIQACKSVVSVFCCTGILYVPLYFLTLFPT